MNDAPKTAEKAATLTARAEPRPGPQRESREDRRVAIAKAARDLICEKGFEGLRTRDIAERVGINIATLHYHVPSKDALIELVAEFAQEEFITQAQMPDNTHLSPRQRLRRELDSYADFTHKRPKLLVIMREFAERGRRDPAVAKSHELMHQTWISIVQPIFEAGVADGSFRPDINPRTAAVMFVGALIGTGKMAATKHADLSDLHDELERCFLNHSSLPPKE